MLFVPEILRIYFIMPFPGSQVEDSLAVAYFLHRYIVFFRIAGVVITVQPLYYYLRHGKLYKKLIFGFCALLYIAVFVFATKFAQADKIFLPPEHKIFATADSNKIDLHNYVLGVALNGEAKAFPIQLIGYHHQVRDTVGGTPVMITYCTVCRSGRAFSPLVNGRGETFRLVGMDHFNAMFEDSTTGSWWRQETGDAVAGPLEGKSLSEIPSQQMTLRAWIALYPKTLIMQRNTDFNEAYDSLARFDRGRRNVIEGDSVSWHPKAWVVGVVADGNAKAYDWRDLKKARVINDTIHGNPVIVMLDADTMTFHAFRSQVGGDYVDSEGVTHVWFDGAPLAILWSDSLQRFTDTRTQSVWNANGECIAGGMKGQRLKPLSSYQENWHSWQTFHPNGTAMKE